MYQYILMWSICFTPNTDLIYPEALCKHKSEASVAQTLLMGQSGEVMHSLCDICCIYMHDCLANEHGVLNSSHEEFLPFRKNESK